MTETSYKTTEEVALLESELPVSILLPKVTLLKEYCRILHCIYNVFTTE